MKTFKKCVAVLLVALTIVSSIPFMSFAASSKTAAKETSVQSTSVQTNKSFFDELMEQNPELKKAVEAAAAKAKTSSYDWFTTILLAILGGSFGIHRFYVGKTETGLIWLLTGGILGIGTIYDVVMLATGKFTDGKGLPIVKK